MFCLQLSDTASLNAATAAEEILEDNAVAVGIMNILWQQGHIQTVWLESFE